ASGGSPGATLAGTISTATHGGEFKKQLLIDKVLAVHLIGPDGKEWWIEGNNEVITIAEIEALYTGINFIGKGWSNKGLDAEDFLRAVVTSMGTMGIIYSVVLEVVPQFSVQQATYRYQSDAFPIIPLIPMPGVNQTGWDKLLKKAGVNVSQLIDKSPIENDKILNFLIDGTLNGTGIAKADNEYMDLAINPLSKTCWIVNRKYLPFIANDDKETDLISNYINSLSSELRESTEPALFSKELTKIGQFLSIPTDIPGMIFGGGVNLNFLNGFQNNGYLFLSALLAKIQVKAKSNVELHPEHPNLGHEFLGDILDGVLNALQGTIEEPKSITSGLATRVGAIGWPNTGMPGRGFEVSMNPKIAFSFVNDLLKRIDEFRLKNKVFLGYISIRLCPQTNTLMGMQQFSPFSVMIEVVAHRTLESNEVFDDLIKFTKGYMSFSSSNIGTYPCFHWGLETEEIDKVYLAKTPLNLPYKDSTRINKFKGVKHYICGSNKNFDNYFVERMGLGV
ncbi:MAG: hypothetical protein PSV35_09005, partial [bacterium]|nr:hypothetical protein [bacterium]